MKNKTTNQINTTIRQQGVIPYCRLSGQPVSMLTGQQAHERCEHPGQSSVEEAGKLHLAQAYDYRDGRSSIKRLRIGP